MDLNPFLIYSRMYPTNRDALVAEFHVHPPRWAAWQAANPPPKTACKLLALRVAQRRGRLPDSMPVSDPRRMSVYLVCKTFDIWWNTLAALLDRNPRLVRQKYSLSEQSSLRGATAHSCDTIPSHEVRYVEILHHLVTVHHIVPPKEADWPGGRWHSQRTAEGVLYRWWVRSDESAAKVMQSRPADVVREGYNLEDLAQLRSTL